MRKLFAVLAASAATAALVALPSAAQARSAAPATYTPLKIAWKACADGDLHKLGAQCGYLVVPLNYAKPRGTKIKVAVSRLRHTTDAKHFQGAMVTNPGGPGGSGLGLVALAQYVPKGAGKAYDWYGFDPRGVGASIPSLSCNGNYFAGDRPPYRPTTAAIEAAWVKRSQAYAAACARTAGHALFGHVRTTDTVADIESLRKAIGQKQINYYGFSYGTYLGSVYMTLHPTRVRRFVLDSTVDPRGVWYGDNLGQDIAFQTSFDVYFRWLARYDSVYHVGKTYAEVRARYLATIAALDKHAAQGVLGGDEFTDVFTQAGYYVYGWEDIAQAYSKYVVSGDASDLIELYTEGQPTGPGADNEYALYLGTQCTDAPWSRNQSHLDADSRRLDRKYNYFTWDNAWYNGPCAYWKFPATRPVKVSGRKVHVKILMIDETLDAATPYSGSLYVRQLFPTASLIEGRNGTTHAGSLSGVACTDDAIATYLATGRTPARQHGNHSDKVCPPVPQPNPLAGTVRSAATTAGAARSAAPAAAPGRSTVLQQILATAHLG